MVRGVGVLLLAALIVPTLTGCLSDLEREHLEVAWEPEVRLVDAPALSVEGWPAMLVLEGSASIPSGRQVEVTGLAATIEAPNRTVEMTATRLVIADRVVQPGQVSEATIRVADGDTVRVGFVPAHGNTPALVAGQAANVTAEVQWRYRDGDRFDAGRLSFDGNLTVAPSPGLGFGATTVENARITRIAFPLVNTSQAPQLSRVEVFAIKGDGKERLGPSQITLSLGTGVLLAELDQPVGVPEGSGYLVLVLGSGETAGVGLHTLPGSGEMTPGPGALVLVTLLGATAVALARTRP